MNQAPSADNKGTFKVRNLVAYSAFGFSLLVHIAVLLVVGGFVLVQGYIPKQAFEELAETTSLEKEETLVLPEEMETLPDRPADQPTLEVTRSEGDPTQNMDVIVSSAPSMNFQLMAGTSLTSPTLGAVKMGGGGDGKAGGGKGGPVMKSFKIFNQQVEGSGIGVILDVSRTTHLFFPLAVKEVAKSFANAPTVLVMGCGLGDAKQQKETNVVPFASLSIAPTNKLVSPPTLENQLGFAMALGKDTEATLKKLRESESVWALQVPPGNIHSTQKAFEKLFGQGVDTIYWFSDFEDKRDPSTLETLKNSLKSKSIKLIAHNFTGKPVPPDLNKVVLDTGGVSITVVPGK